MNEPVNSASLLNMPDRDFLMAWQAMDALEIEALPNDIAEKGRQRYLKVCPTFYNITDRAAQFLDEQEKSNIKWPDALDLKFLAQREPEAPRFIVPDWWPVAYAALLSGHGGVGKSAIALTLAVCVALGIPFFGLQVARRRVLYLSCEDRENVLHWRLARICKYLGVDMGSLRGWLNIVDLVGHDAILWERDPRTGYTLTSAYSALDQRISEYQTEVLMVDGISDTFGGNENARAEVKRYINSLVALIPEHRGAVLLIGHVAKPNAASAQTSEGYSGSTGWHNSVRARWYLYPETAQSDGGERPDRTGDLILELQKSNLGVMDQSMRFSWDAQAHMFLGREIVAATASDRYHRDRNEQDGIISAFKDCAANSITVPTATQGLRTGYQALSLRPEFPKTLIGPQGKRRFWRHIETLRQINLIEEREYRRKNRHSGSELIIKEEA